VCVGSTHALTHTHAHARHTCEGLAVTCMYVWRVTGREAERSDYSEDKDRTKCKLVNAKVCFWRMGHTL